MKKETEKLIAKGLHHKLTVSELDTLTKSYLKSTRIEQEEIGFVLQMVKLNELKGRIGNFSDTNLLTKLNDSCQLHKKTIQRLNTTIVLLSILLIAFLIKFFL